MRTMNLKPGCLLSFEPLLAFLFFFLPANEKTENDSYRALPGNHKTPNAVRTPCQRLIHLYNKVIQDCSFQASRLDESWIFKRLHIRTPPSGPFSSSAATHPFPLVPLQRSVHELHRHLLVLGQPGQDELEEPAGRKHRSTLLFRCEIRCWPPLCSTPQSENFVFFLMSVSLATEQCSCFLLCSSDPNFEIFKSRFHHVAFRGFLFNVSFFCFRSIHLMEISDDWRCEKHFVWSVPH